MDRLFEVLAASLPEGAPAYPDDFLTSTPETEWIAEVIREKLLERTRDELPFAHAVVVESVRQAEGKDMTVVTASVVVEREGQKAIVVGKGGTMIREIGRAAREELEEELGRRLYLRADRAGEARLAKRRGISFAAARGPGDLNRARGLRLRAGGSG